MASQPSLDEREQPEIAGSKVRRVGCRPQNFEPGSFNIAGNTLGSLRASFIVMEDEPINVCLSVPAFPGCDHGIEAVFDIAVAVDLLVRCVHVAVHRARLREKYAGHKFLLVMRSAGLLRRLVAEMHPHLPLQADYRVINPLSSFIPSHQVVHLLRASIAIDSEEFCANSTRVFF